jgi:hypothetical protein
MNQVRLAAGYEARDVQLARIFSPSEYFCFSAKTVGSPSGRSGNNNKIKFRCYWRLAVVFGIANPRQFLNKFSETWPASFVSYEIYSFLLDLSDYKELLPNNLSWNHWSGGRISELNLRNRSWSNYYESLITTLDINTSSFGKLNFKNKFKAMAKSK